ncbi:MAG: adenylate cyclase [Betaproteobacteria bacterium RIFCSPLOWO2_12_FULL_62_58]|nr:MAG: adenylate cyclase [Betaproteobacteria bacterium RIFCSPLOWO2_12_FULL_62_58]
MKKSILWDTVRRVQDIIAAETGAPLTSAAEQQLENLLGDVTGLSAASSTSEKFSSREVTILLTDLRGFTSISENYPVGVVLGLLNRYLIKMSDIVSRHGGTIDKFMGDSIMVLFGAPYTHTDDVKRALTCAVDMQLAMEDVNQYHRQIGTPELFMGIGINTGTVMAGTLGSDLYSEYTVIGDEVNLASRIEAFSLRGQVLISESTFDRCRDFVQTDEPMDVYVKGKAHPVSLREVLAIPSLGKEVPRQEIRKSPRVEVTIPFTYQVVENKIVMPQLHHGVILDISYHGVLTEVGQDLAPHSDIKLTLDLSLVGYTAADVYAKILKTRPSEGRYVSSIEFTSVSVQSTMNIKHFVQLLIQGSDVK